MIDPGFILRAIENGPMTTAAIADHLNADYGDVRDQIGRLLKDGRIKVCGHRGGKAGVPGCDRIPIFEPYQPYKRVAQLVRKATENDKYWGCEQCRSTPSPTLPTSGPPPDFITASKSKP